MGEGLGRRPPVEQQSKSVPRTIERSALWGSRRDLEQKGEGVEGNRLWVQSMTVGHCSELSGNQTERLVVNYIHDITRHSSVKWVKRDRT